MAVLAFFRIRFAVYFWSRLRIVAFVYVGVILALALIQLLFHVQL
jgi:hypothetical protein